MGSNRYCCIWADRCLFTKKQFALWILISSAFFVSTRSAFAATSQQDANAVLSRSFRCPEEYSSNDAKTASLQEFIRAYKAQYPNNNVRDLMLFRYRLLVDHSCIQTLKSMLSAVSPLSEMLRFVNQDFGPRTEEYDARTKVWSVWFRKDGETPELSEANLIFNFYGWPGPSAENMAKAFINPRSDRRIIGKFEAPDELTHLPAYFIVSETLYPGESYGYVNVTKITSVGTGTYAVTLTKKIKGSTTEEIAQKGQFWFTSEDGKVSSRELGRISVDSSWEQHFAQKH